MRAALKNDDSFDKSDDTNDEDDVLCCYPLDLANDRSVVG